MKGSLEIHTVIQVHSHMNGVFCMTRIRFDVLSIQVTIFKACDEYHRMSNVIANAY